MPGLGVLPQQFVIEGRAGSAGRRQPVTRLAHPLRRRAPVARRRRDRSFCRKLHDFGPFGGGTHQPTQIQRRSAHASCNQF